MSRTLGSFAVGRRVQLAPHTDRWMAGDRFGTVKEITGRAVHVKFDWSGQTVKIKNADVDNLLTLID